MPAKNTVKIYYENGFYHVYNRGVEKRLIFIDEQDCRVFLYYLKLYLCPKEEIEETVILSKMRHKFIHLNLSSEVDLIAFALMPNHFHLLLKQTSIDGITKLLKRVTTAYVMYFNRKYQRVGPLFQGIFKACSIETDEHLLHLSRYIHLNPRKLNTSINFDTYSSYSYYVTRKTESWIKPAAILDYFKPSSYKNTKFTYKSFVEGYAQKSEDLLGERTLEDNCFN